ncbi:MAG: hypothetical protein ACRC7O_03380 [Fimbriiglobus sp.]
MIAKIYTVSGGYPYFIQYICRELFDVAISTNVGRDRPMPFDATFDSITRKLDGDFFSGRWAKTTDRQRELLTAVAHLPTAGEEFTVQDAVEESKARLTKPFGASHVNRLFQTLGEMGLVYKNRHGRYSFAVRMLRQFILRQTGA